MAAPAASFVLRSRRVVTGDAVEPAEIVITGDRVVHVEPARAARAADPRSARAPGRVIDLGEAIVAPGLVDTQINGAGAIDLRRTPGALVTMCAHAARCGVTTLVPTLPSHDLDRDLLGDLRRAADGISDDDAPVAAVAGVHLEGPFLAPGRAGAHRSVDLRRVDAAVVDAWSRDAFVAIVTLAPELDGALDAIATLSDAGVCVALGHTDADVGQVRAAVDAGARHVTHLWNAMAGLHHRAPGLPGVALTDRRLTSSLICDGAHVDPLVVSLTWQALGPARLVLVSDAVAWIDPDSGADRRDGTGPVAVTSADGVLQGAATMLDEGLRNLVAASGASVPEALATVTRNPARLLGRDDIGVLAPGARADIVVFDDGLVPRHVLVAGEWVDGMAPSAG